MVARSAAGFAVDASNVLLKRNIALKNDRHGFTTESDLNTFTGNVAGFNAEFAIFANDVVASARNVVFGNGEDPQCSTAVTCKELF